MWVILSIYHIAAVPYIVYTVVHYTIITNDTIDSFACIYYSMYYCNTIIDVGEDKSQHLVILLCTVDSIQ